MKELQRDGSWSGNVYDFFRRVYPKLTTDLKVPFQLQDGQRVDDTPIHEALREALTNTLIHADYSERVSVLVVKWPIDMFTFRNPGYMRISPSQAIRGGNSDCRNRRLQTMFQLVGYGDHAGSGLPKIYKNWADQHWRRPLLYEAEPAQTMMVLKMSSLVPEWAIEELMRRLGSRFSALPTTARQALITAQVEDLVSNDRLKESSAEHPSDLTKVLRALVRDGLLISKGTGRGTIYHLPWRSGVITPLERAESERFVENSKPPELGLKPPELGLKPPELMSYLDWATIPETEQAELLKLAAPVATQRKVNASVLRETVLMLCRGRFLGLRVLAYTLKRDSDDLRKRTLTPMVQGGLLRAAYPNARNPRQAYTSPNMPTPQQRIGAQGFEP